MPNPSFRASTKTTGLAASATITKPAGTVDGDYVLIYVALGVSTVSVGPTGFGSPILGPLAISGMIGPLYIYAKVASGEGASWPITFAGSGNFVVIAVAVKDGALAGQPDDMDTTTGSGNSMPANGNAMTAAGHLMLGVWAVGGSEVFTKPASMTLIDSGTVSGANNAAEMVAWESIALGGVTGSRTATRVGNGNSGWGAVLLGVKAVPAGGAGAGKRFWRRRGLRAR